MRRVLIGWAIAAGCTGAVEQPEREAAPAAVALPPLPADEPPPEPLFTPTEPRYAATQVLIAWKGAVQAPASVERSEAEAKTLAETVRERALAGEDLGALARERSDAPSGARGGSVGVYLTGTMVPEFESAVAQVAVGEIGPLVRSPFGFHVVRRDPIVQARVRHVLVAWQGAERSVALRSKDEARERAEQALARLEKGEDFAAVARELSDDPSASAGGDLGVVAPGQMVPAFEQAVFALEEGQRSGLVETPYGFHVVERTE